MHWRRAGLVIAPALLAAAGWSAEARASFAAPASPLAEPPGDPVPERLLGRWVYSHEQCEPDAELEPDPRKIVAAIDLVADRTYRLDVEGFHFEGAYRFRDGENPRITLDTMVNFDPVGDTLQNWSEGDAVYQCGRVFVRERQRAGGDR